MSRGGTKKNRAKQDEARRKRERQAAVKAKDARKAAERERPKAGKGRAALLHLAGLPAPFIVAFGLVLTGHVLQEGAAPTAYWAGALIGEPNAPYWREPGGLMIAGAILAVGLAVFLVLPIAVWRYAYRDKPVVERDRTSVDNAATLMAVALALWVWRIAAGYSEPFQNVVAFVVILTVYVPAFSALLALILPPVPGLGRIGGVLPDFMKLPFTEWALLDEGERAVVRASSAAAKAARRRPST